MSDLTPSSAATILGCSKRKVQELLQLGELEGYRVGKLWRIEAAALEKFKRRHSNQPASNVVAIGGVR